MTNAEHSTINANLTIVFSNYIKLIDSIYFVHSTVQFVVIVPVNCSRPLSLMSFSSSPLARRYFALFLFCTLARSALKIHCRINSPLYVSIRATQHTILCKAHSQTFASPSLKHQLLTVKLIQPASTQTENKQNT